MLSPYRVLDLTNERGLLCGQILADLGADVIAVEPPGGNSARRLGPFAGDEPGPERSLYWWAFSRNKRSVTLDIATKQGREELLKLAKGAHFLIESEAPGRTAELGLGYEELAKVNPALVYVSISAFGQDGPKAGYAESDLIVEAAGGNLVLQGDEDRPPVRVSVPQAYLHAGAEAAGAALIAHHERVRSGRGQHVDVSAQQAVNQATFATGLVTPFGGDLVTRIAGGFKAGPLILKLLYPARDGHVAILLFFGSTIGPFTQRLVDCLHEEGLCDDRTRDTDWIGFAVPLLTKDVEAIQQFEELKRAIEQFTAGKTKDELLKLALERRLLIAPIVTIGDVVTSEQFAERKYWTEVEQSPQHRYRYPGAFAKFSEQPISYRHPAPTIGQHTHEVLNDLGRRPAISDANGLQRDQPPLSDVKVLDLTWVIAGPAATRVLADYGATVIKVESTSRVDVARTMGPHTDGQPDPEHSGAYVTFNAGKRGVTLDLTKDEGHSVILDLVRWADVVTESFSPKAMSGFGLDYRALKKVKPDIIMLSSCLMGQNGPLSMFAGFGNLSAAISGFYNITGWPDRLPAGPFLAYTDTVAPRYSIAAILAALDHRRRTGQGQYIDQSQAESALHFLGPALLDYTVNGREQNRMGNRDLHMAPHGVYPVAGEDRWVAIAVATDDQWRALCEAIGNPELEADDRFAVAAARLSHQDDLDTILSAWTKLRSAEEAEERLQSRGVPAHVVQNSPELYADPQLQHRGHFVEVPHEIHDPTTVEGSRFKLSRTPAKIERAGPTFGQHNQYVLETILGYSEEKIADLVASGVLE